MAVGIKTIVLGGPRTGKTTLADRLACPTILHTDDLIADHEWSEASRIVAEEWITADGPWVIEGVACARALRKWIAAGHKGKPCDRIIVLDIPLVELTKGQTSMAKGCAKVWGEIRSELVRRGVDVRAAVAE